MKLLDLFSGAGGSAMGYYQAGFTDIMGVDVNPDLVNYPFDYAPVDVFDFGVEDYVDLNGVDLIHASPPCQAYSTTKSLHDNRYPDYIAPIRHILKRTGKPYVIENVVGAPLINPILLCGSSFSLGVRRHRLFESNMALFSTGCRHDLQPEPIDVTGTGGPSGKPRMDGGGIHRKPKNLEHAREVMGINWMTRTELAEAVPPAYTRFIGSQILEQLERAA